jgi:hypothetical protein
MELFKSAELEKILLINAATEYSQSSWGVMGKQITLFLQYFNAYTLSEAPRLFVVMKAFRTCNSDMCTQTDMANMLIEDFLYDLHLKLNNIQVSDLFNKKAILNNAWYAQFVEYTCEQINNFWIESGNKKRLTNTGVIKLLDVSQSKHSEWQAQKKVGQTLPLYVARSALTLGDISVKELSLRLI